MKQFQYTIWSIVVLCLIVSCKNQKPPSQKETTLQSSIEAILGVSYQEFYNQDSTFLLCSTTITSPRPVVTKFVVCQTDKQEIIFQSSVKDGFVKWYSDSKLLIKDQPGIEMKEPTNHTYLIDLSTKRKTAYNPKNNE
ncbi:hypothetical protein [Reichenbachiella ulvae]|uniref:Lipoprotein n=1 Tax=Reichenbachiella ulvae TaxID=2980104 RepID=A0ABT3CYX3_9BACT|nr:hypothetical protein [Reichenbachiella ulvae]MCV9388408.1 hypothetical protein [Reichenbachiella ulvae]